MGTGRSMRGFRGDMEEPRLRGLPCRTHKKGVVSSWDMHVSVVWQVRKAKAELTNAAGRVMIHQDQARCAPSAQETRCRLLI